VEHSVNTGASSSVIMSLNMVANRVEKGINVPYLEKLVTKLRMSKDKTFAENIPEWEEALKNTFATAGIGHLLYKFSNRMAPPDQVAILQVRREMGLVISGIRNVSTVKSPPIQVESELPKVGSDDDDDVDEGDEMKAFKSSGKFSGLISETERLDRLEARIRETAKEMTDELLLEHAQSESRGVRKEVIFLESMTAVPVDEAYLNPSASILTTVEGVTRLYEPESDLKRMQRQGGWQLITQSIIDMPPANWKSVSLGNVYGLYSLITSHYRENDRKSVVKELSARVSSLTKHKSELFVTFFARYEQLVLEMEKVGMGMDDDVLYTHVERALTESDDRRLKQIYESSLLLSGKPETTQALFESLLPAMKRLENNAHKKHDLYDMDDESNEEKKKKQEARALKAQAYGKADSAARKGGAGDIMGTCLEYSTTGKCPRAHCPFDHTRLSRQENDRLRDLMRQAREKKGVGGDRPPVKCYACDEMGHISTYCPYKTKKTMIMPVIDTKTTSKAGVKTADSARARQMHEHTQSMSDDQVVLLARTLISQRDQEGAGDLG
jgi:hypothetical protein